MTILRPAIVFPNVYVFTAVKTAIYTAVASDAVLCNTTGGTFAVTLPNLIANNRIRVKWTVGTIAPTIIAGASAAIDTSWTGFGVINDSADFQYDGAIWQLV